MIMQIPFYGFYESEVSQFLDYSEEQLCEWLAENDSRFAGRDAGDIADAIYWTASYGFARDYIARGYAEALADAIADETGVSPAWTFESMASPREYNFTTDRIFVTVEPETVQRMRDAIDPEIWQRVLAERHKSRDGFISSYSHDPADWQDKPTADLDHNELETVLVAWLETVWTVDQAERAALDALQDASAYDTALDKALDLDAAAARLLERAA